MAEPLKHKYGLSVPSQIAQRITAVHGAFDGEAFCQDVAAGYEQLELMPRAHRMADMLARYLPAEFPVAADILTRSLGPVLEQTLRNGMTPFVYLPHVFYVMKYGLAYPQVSLELQYQLTQRFTAEFSIRPYIEQHPDITFEYFERWVNDPSEHVRRLVSEGTRPRLPWAPRLRAFQQHPGPMLPLLDRLKDDPSDYVRRSVANHLNDIGKDNPDVLIDTASAWLQDAPAPRRRLVRHALRSLVKAGHPEALMLQGFGIQAAWVVHEATVQPEQVRLGGAVTVRCEVSHDANSAQGMNLDYVLIRPMAHGKTGRKVFKLKTCTVPAGHTLCAVKSLSLAAMSTRTYHPGVHLIEWVLNGQTIATSQFMVLG